MAFFRDRKNMQYFRQNHKDKTTPDRQSLTGDSTVPGLNSTPEPQDNRQRVTSMEVNVNPDATD